MSKKNDGAAKTDPREVSRRKFLGGAIGAAATVSIVPRHVLGGAGQKPPSEKINLAFIGVGGRGRDNLNSLRGENIVALCDVDEARGAESFKEFPKLPRYKDFRKMLDKESDIEAVVISTPDHTHAVATMMALQMGKHVYCEKPLTRTIHEARLIAREARRAKVATQMGNQGMAFEGNRLINEWIDDGAIGPVHEVHVWSDRPSHNGSLFWAQGIDRPKETPPVPPTLDWDLWLGPAPHRPYHPAYAPFVWRGWWDFGSGGLGDMGIHNLAPAFSALKLGPPISVESSSTIVNQETLPLASTVHYEFPARGNMPPVRLHWYDGGIIPARPPELEDDRELSREDGLIFVGEKGKMYVQGWGGHSPRLIPDAKMKAYKRPPQTLPRSIGHHEEWLRACKEGTPTRSNFDFAGPLTETVLLGTLSERMGGKRLNWNSQEMKITNEPEANKYIHYPYREGWKLKRLY